MGSHKAKSKNFGKHTPKKHKSQRTFTGGDGSDPLGAAQAAGYSMGGDSSDSSGTTSTSSGGGYSNATGVADYLGGDRVTAFTTSQGGQFPTSKDPSWGQRTTSPVQQQASDQYYGVTQADAQAAASQAATIRQQQQAETDAFMLAEARRLQESAGVRAASETSPHHMERILAEATKKQTGQVMAGTDVWGSSRVVSNAQAEREIQITLAKIHIQNTQGDIQSIQTRLSEIDGIVEAEKNRLLAENRGQYDTNNEAMLISDSSIYAAVKTEKERLESELEAKEKYLAQEEATKAKWEGDIVSAAGAAFTGGISMEINPMATDTQFNPPVKIEKIEYNDPLTGGVMPELPVQTPTKKPDSVIGTDEKPISVFSAFEGLSLNPLPNVYGADEKINVVTPDQSKIYPWLSVTPDTDADAKQAQIPTDAQVGMTDAELGAYNKELFQQKYETGEDTPLTHNIISKIEGDIEPSKLFTPIIEDGKFTGDYKLDESVNTLEKRQQYRDKLGDLRDAGKTLDSEGNEISLSDPDGLANYMIRHTELNRADEVAGTGMFDAEAYGKTVEAEHYVFGAERIDESTKKHLDKLGVDTDQYKVLDADIAGLRQEGLEAAEAMGEGYYYHHTDADGKMSFIQVRESGLVPVGHAPKSMWRDLDGDGTKESPPLPTHGQNFVRVSTTLERDTPRGQMLELALARQQQNAYLNALQKERYDAATFGTMSIQSFVDEVTKQGIGDPKTTAKFFEQRGYDMSAPMGSVSLSKFDREAATTVKRDDTGKVISRTIDFPHMTDPSLPNPYVKQGEVQVGVEPDKITIEREQLLQPDGTYKEGAVKSYKTESGLPILMTGAELYGTEGFEMKPIQETFARDRICLLYTSDAADE